jgi:DNA-binding CsgD family transcriptional regulator
MIRIFRPQAFEPRSLPKLLEGTPWDELIRTLGLSPREGEVLVCMFSDNRAAAIAQKLEISVGTVHTYRERMFRKLGVHSCAQVICVAFTAYVQLNAEPAHERRSINGDGLSPGSPATLV